VITAQSTKLKQGYKLTEVGVIPEEWNVKPLKQLSPRQCVGVVVNPSSYFDDEGTVPFLVGSNVGENSINWRTAKRISDASNQILGTTRLAAGDLVTVRVGEPGVTAVIPPELDGCNCASMMIVRQHPSFDSHWLSWVMNSRIGRLQVDHVQYGTAQKQFNISDAVDFCYPVPPLPEQRAIAEALSDIDYIIASLDQLIAKKRDIKQATMQQLLTGKTRLPGFSRELKPAYKQTEVGMVPEDWEVCSLGDIVTKVGSGITPRGGEKVYKKEGRPFLRSQNVGWGHLLLDDIVFIDEKTHNSFLATEIKLDDVLLNITGASIGRSAVADNRLLGGNVNQHVCIIRADASKSSPYYLIFFLLSEIGQKQIESFQAGGNRQGLNFGQIKSFLIPLPSLPEQTAIAAVLSDMDAEIASLEQKRDKTRALKQGMMQELLTGRTRLL